MTDTVLQCQTIQELQEAIRYSIELMNDNEENNFITRYACNVSSMWK